MVQGSRSSLCMISVSSGGGSNDGRRRAQDVGSLVWLDTDEGADVLACREPSVRDLADDLTHLVEVLSIHHCRRLGAGHLKIEAGGLRRRYRVCGVEVWDEGISGSRPLGAVAVDRSADDVRKNTHFCPSSSRLLRNSSQDIFPRQPQH